MEVLFSETFHLMQVHFRKFVELQGEGQGGFTKVQTNPCI